jgi:pimeloyl-ACP methyl ester carboxylesterase
MSDPASGPVSSEGRIRLRRDAQKWAFDKAINDTGRVFHYQLSGRGQLPPGVKMHAMISKHVGSNAARLERVAKAEADAGHDTTALEFYFDAATAYSRAQHTVFAVNDEKRFLYDGLLRCYDEVRRLSPTAIEKLEIPFGSGAVTGYLHLAQVDGPAPLVFYIPGCDQTKEIFPHPLYNTAHQRGMHIFSFDGPGQGESNLRGIRLTLDNYEKAASAALDVLLERPEIDASKVGLYSFSFGSYWGARLAATDSRIAAAVGMWASIADKYFLFEEDSPRFKQLFAFITGAASEAELDEFREQMGLEDLLPRIACPILLAVGQYDPRSPLEEVYELFDTITAPKQLWVYEDQHHNASLRGGSPSEWIGDQHSTAVDWIRDRVDGKPLIGSGEVTWLPPKGPSPNDPAASHRRHWFEA